MIQCFKKYNIVNFIIILYRMSTCPPNAVTSVQDVATGNITCYDANGNIIGTPIIVNSPIPVGPGNQCIIPSTATIVTNLATNYYQCKLSNGNVTSNSKPCPTGYASTQGATLNLNGTLSYTCFKSGGTANSFTCPLNVTPIVNPTGYQGTSPSYTCNILPPVSNGSLSPAPSSNIYGPAPTSSLFSPAPTSSLFSPAPSANVRGLAPTSSLLSPAPSGNVYGPAPTSSLFSPEPTSFLFSPAPSNTNSPKIYSNIFSPAPTSTYGPAPSNIQFIPPSGSPVTGSSLTRNTYKNYIISYGYTLSDLNNDQVKFNELWDNFKQFKGGNITLPGGSIVSVSSGPSGSALVSILQVVVMFQVSLERFVNANATPTFADNGTDVQTIMISCTITNSNLNNPPKTNDFLSATCIGNWLVAVLTILLLSSSITEPFKVPFNTLPAYNATAYNTLNEPPLRNTNVQQNPVLLNVLNLPTSNIGNFTNTQIINKTIEHIINPTGQTTPSTANDSVDIDFQCPPSTILCTIA
jgi:hypothetical protein